MEKFTDVADILEEILDSTNKNKLIAKLKAAVRTRSSPGKVAGSGQPSVQNRNTLLWIALKGFVEY